jgi:tRNA(Ile)-lysidine synthase
MPRLAEEGLDARRLSLLAQRLRRADQAIDAAVDRAMAELRRSGASTAQGFDATGFARLPAEIALRLLGRTIAEFGCEGPVELGKLEALAAALCDAQNSGSGLRRSLAGAVVTLAKGNSGPITVETAPARRSNVRRAALKSLTKRRPGGAPRPKTR